MKYFSLSNSTNEKEVGKTWPQCKGLADGYTKEWLDQPSSMTNLNNNEFPNLQPDLIFDLDEKAELSDVISPSMISAKGLLLNQKVKDILEDFNLMSHKYYPATVREKSNDYQYYWLHIVKPDLLGINFKESEFEITNLINMPEANIKINSWDHFMKRKMSLPMKHINAKKLVIEFELQKDLIFFPYIYSYMFISEDLALELASQKVTGLEITEQSIL